MKKITIIQTLFILALPTFLFSQNKHFQGAWSKLGTTYSFEFDLYLHHAENNKVEGFFDWKVANMDENSQLSINHYDSRIGTTAKEFVKGKYNPLKREYHIIGYRKEDPNLIISLDEYFLQVDKIGELEGKTKAHGTWKGRIKGKETNKEDS